MGDIVDWTLAEVADAIAARRVSAVEVTAAVLSQIAERQPQLNAYIRIDPDGARAAAKAADEHLARHGTTGVLHGVPLGAQGHVLSAWRAGHLRLGDPAQFPARTIWRPCSPVSMPPAQSPSGRST